MHKIAGIRPYGFANTFAMLPMMDQSHSTKTAIIVAVIGGLALVLAATITGLFAFVSSRPSLADAGLVIEEITAVPQFANRKYYEDKPGSMRDLSGNEIATFKVTLKNYSSKVLRLLKGEFVLDDLTERDGLGSTVVLIPLMDHEGHITVPVSAWAVGDCLQFPINRTIEPHARRELIIWFKGTNANAPDILFLTGYFRIQSNEGTVSSGPVEMELHQETQSMRKSYKSGIVE